MTSAIRLVRILVPAWLFLSLVSKVIHTASNARPQTQERTSKRRPQRNEPLDIAESETERQEA